MVLELGQRDALGVDLQPTGLTCTLRCPRA
jgi:hypothetical protein